MPTRIVGQLKAKVHCRQCATDISDECRILLLESGTLSMEIECPNCGYAEIDLSLEKGERDAE
jgi:hypothetical protein